MPSSSTGHLVREGRATKDRSQRFISSHRIQTDTSGPPRQQPALLPAALWRWAGCSQDSTWSPPRAEGRRQPTDRRPNIDPGRHPFSSPALPSPPRCPPVPGRTWPPPPQRPLYTPGLSSCRPSSRSQAYCGWPTSSEDMVATDRRHPARVCSSSSEAAARRQPSIACSPARVGERRRDGRRARPHAAHADWWGRGVAPRQAATPRGGAPCRSAVCQPRSPRRPRPSWKASPAAGRCS